MGAIRPLDRQDIPQAADLYEYVARSGSRTAPPGLVRHFESTYLDHPWADPEIPSLVYVDDDGAVAGFLGSTVRRLVFDGRPIRMGVSGQLVTEPAVRTQAVGMFLMKEYAGGPQELSISDTASETVRRIWEGIGGETAHLHCIGWIRLFRPFQAAMAIRSRRARPGTARTDLAPLWSGLDRLSASASRGMLRPPASRATAEPATPDAIAAHIHAVAGAARLRPAYEDEQFVAWLLDVIARTSGRGQLVTHLVRVGGRLRGWYVYLLPSDGIAQVLTIAGDDRTLSDVLDKLFADAWSRGAVAVQGRVEAHLLHCLAQRRCLFHPSGYLALLHSRDRELLYAIQSGQALLTRMEGDWWSGHHLLPFTDSDTV